MKGYIKISECDYLAYLGANLFVSESLPLHRGDIHLGIKHPIPDSTTTTGFYYPKCDTVLISCDSREKSLALYKKYSAYKISSGTNTFRSEAAFKDIRILEFKSVCKTFRSVRQEMEKLNIPLVNYRRAGGIGDGYSYNDCIFFLKGGAVDTIKSDAPHYILDKLRVITPFLKKAKANQNTLIKKGKEDTIFHTYPNA